MKKGTLLGILSMKWLHSMPLYGQILTGMLWGVGVGWLAVYGQAGDTVSGFLGPIGVWFMNALKMIAIPLVLLSLIQSMASMGSIGSLGSLGGRTLFVYIGTTVLAITVGIGWAWLLSPGEWVGDMRASGVGLPTLLPSSDAFRWEQLIPDNLLGALISNGNMLQVIVIVIAIGIAALMAGEAARPFVGLVGSMNAVLLKLIDLVMLFAPLGVMVLMGQTVIDSAGDISLLSSLLIYAVTVVLAQLTLIYGVYGGSFVVVMMVLTALGLPVEAMALVMSIDRPLDMLRTATNVTGDSAVALIVDRATVAKRV